MCKVIALPGYEWITEECYTDDARRYTSCNHELECGEVWLGNTSGENRWEKGVDIPIKYRGLKTIRLGKQAYCIHGLPLSRHYCLPLIIHKSEVSEFYKLQKEIV